MIHRLITIPNQTGPRSDGVLSGARALGFHQLLRAECQDLFFIESQLSQEDMQQLALKLFIDPVAQSVSWDELPMKVPSPSRLEPHTTILEVVLRPGVTDPVANEIVRAAHELGYPSVHRAATGTRYVLAFDADTEINSAAEKLACALLANPTIHHWKIGEFDPSFPLEARPSGEVTILPIRSLSDDGLLALSGDRRAALDLEEMKAIQAGCLREGR
jgi:phosphoribosylformylglycinamidine (FGAM) synthase PurS component